MLTIINQCKKRKQFRVWGKKETIELCKKCCMIASWPVAVKAFALGAIEAILATDVSVLNGKKTCAVALSGAISLGKRQATKGQPW